MRHKSNTLGKYRNSSLYRATVSFLPCGLWCPGDCGAPEGSLSFAKQLYVFILHKLATYVTSIRFRYVLAPPSMAAHANLLQNKSEHLLSSLYERSGAPQSPGHRHLQGATTSRVPPFAGCRINKRFVFYSIYIRECGIMKHVTVF